MSRYISAKLEREVRTRAGLRCEYCHIPESCLTFSHVSDHVIARQHRGATSAKNLALSCARCNRHKGPNIAGVDPKTGVVTTLFNPRLHHWHEHFRWNGTVLVGLTEVGRTTIEVLAINGSERVALREQLMKSGEFPGDFQ
jgi:hypothetical protein